MIYFKEGLKNYVVLLPVFSGVQVLLYIFYKRAGIRVKPGFVIGWQLLSLLLCCIFSVTGVPGISDLSRYGEEIIRREQINLILFNSSLNSGLVSIVLIFMLNFFVTYKNLWHP